VSSTQNSSSFLDQHHFLLRRLHSLSGIVPVGVFLINHLLTNSTAWLSPGQFDEHVSWIHHMPFLAALEWGGIFLPIAFHAIYGVVIALQGRSNVASYPYMDNWRYTLQRVTAWITLVFIVVHLIHFRFAHWFGGLDYKASADYFFFWTQQGFSMVLPQGVWMVIYAIGLLAAVFHFSNGIVTFCITWGITVGDKARQRLSYAAGGLGLVLLIWGFLSLYAIATTDAGEERTPPPGHPVSEYLSLSGSAEREPDVIRE
jgi:succinate dehydrogenase / fumarate reductase cytochrome b subunit